MATFPTRQIEAIEPVMVRVPEGWFWMGCETGRDDEKPVHRVWVDAFELAACQLTNEEYARFLGAMHHPPPLCWKDPNFSDPKMPVVAVSWREAVGYCEWLSRATGKSYRLPSEAEWERAARGGAEHLLYPWGDAPPEQVPNYAERWKSGPEPVGMYPPNTYGLHNLGDNVHEWCLDWYSAGYYSGSPERNPRGPSNGSRRASRGGSWRHHIKVTRTAARSSIPPEFQYADYGFRVARSVNT
ncbi:MAG TPA: SUMF1/EgtB/PvdO family nonheme iron enzyme [Candidatus Polarisedimenticolia bacterium]|nr:SUMF1/EgtB/PvdO family nonheme iron enzyme [Candidatus Polarisedimenticolia bacterium]